MKQTAYNFAEEIKDFTDISREGYYFDGWYLNANYTDKQEMPKVMPAHNVELYGRWVADKVYKEVKFMNGNVQVAIKSVAVNEKITEPAAPAKVGYTFVGWYKEAELIEKFDFENEVMGDKNLTLYAKWEINSYTILLVSNLEGLNLSNKVREYNARIGNLFSSSEKNELLSYPGYTFVGWYVDEELTKPFEKISMPAEDITLYAKWHFDGIKLVINGEIFKTISGKQGDAVDASLITVPNIEGYTFRGWFLSENPLPSDSKYEFNVLPKEQVVVYGVYDLVEYTITYYTDNGELSLEKDTYMIIAGERRYRASIIAGKETIPAVIKDIPIKDVLEIALIENLQREDLNAIEEALAYKGLIENYKVTQEELSEAVGKSRPHITNTLRLLNLQSKIIKMIENGEIDVIYKSNKTY